MSNILTNSEQQLVDCSTANYGCNGGWYDAAWRYLASAGGQATAESYPYNGFQAYCKYPDFSVKGAEVSAATPVTLVRAKDTATMLNLVSNKHLLSVAIAVVNSFFNYQYVNKLVSLILTFSKISELHFISSLL